MQAQLSGKS